MASIFQHFAAFQLKRAQVRHLFARHAGAQPLLRHGVFIFLSGKAHFAGVYFKEFRQRVGNKAGIAAVFQNSHQNMFTFTVRFEAQILDHHEIFRIGFQ
jgi:hypothetical protein